MLEVYKNIKRIRELKGISQDELARSVGFKSRSSINKIEQGVNDITQSKLAAIAKALSVSPGELMGKEATDVLDTLQYEMKLTADEADVIRAFVAMPHEQRQEGVNFIKNLATQLEALPAPREPHEDVPAQQEPVDTPPQPNADGTYTVTVHPDDWKALEELKKRESLMSAASISTGEKRA